MNSSYPFSAAAEEQAALWAARLDGSILTATDRSALDAWLAANPAHRTLLSSYCQFSADLEQQLPALVATGAVTMPAKKTTASSQRTWWLAGLGLAAAAAIVLGVWAVQPTHRPETIATVAAHRQSLTLSDGTHVELNARTRLTVDLGKSERRVRLLEGEAFFQVSKDPSRPFIVETPSGSIRVTGTTFNVRCENPTTLDVVVVEGSVQVTAGKSAGAPVSLHANDHFSSSNNVTSVHALSASSLAEALAWRQGRIISRNLRLVDVIARFERYHDRVVTISPAAAAADLHVGGQFSLDDAPSFLSDLETMKPELRITSNTHGAVSVKLRTEP